MNAYLSFEIGLFHFTFGISVFSYFCISVVVVVVVVFNWDSLCKAEQPLRGMVLQERKKSTKKITGYRKSVLILDLKPLRS